ncbi:flagellar basal body-associated FliL family protein [Granulosicoccaceae sp. 1_MG-2023]|nr:flagellar basal body-associated FliL family protein [Granulosicoccaceae sp. 1_MG-2023]
MKKIIMLAGGAVLLVGASVGATLFFTGGNAPPPEMAAAAAEAKPDITYYYDMKPEFIVNFAGNASSHFFMVELSLSTKDEKTLEVLETHDAELRNSLLMLLGNQDHVLVTTERGKRALQEEVLETAQTVVEKHYGSPAVEGAFFTKFVVQ